MKNIFKHSVLIAVMITTSVNAATIGFFPLKKSSNNEYYITITGEIKEGDKEKFARIIRFLNKSKTPINNVYLDIPGGNEEDGYAIMKFIMINQLATYVLKDAECSGSCINVLLGGSPRTIDPESIIGINRITNLKNSEWLKDNVSYEEKLADHYHQMGFPESSITGLLNTPSDKKYFLSKEEKEELNSKNRNGGNIPPEIKILSELTTSFNYEDVDLNAAVKSGDYKDNKYFSYFLREGANSLSESGNYSKSIEFYNEALKIDPGDGIALLGLAGSYMFAKDHIAAKETLTKFLTLYPTYSDVWLNLSNLEMFLGEEENAIDALVNYYNNSGDKEEALKVLNDAIAHDNAPVAVKTKLKLGLK